MRFPPRTDASRERPHDAAHDARPRRVAVDRVENTDGRAADVLVLRAIEKSYPVGTNDRAVRCAVVRGVSLRARHGAPVAIEGEGIGPLTVLRCVAGHVAPDGGEVAWYDRQGTRVPAPPVGLVPGGWRATCAAYTVRDALEASVCGRAPQAVADARIAAVLALLGLRGGARALVRGLHPIVRWQVGIAAALVGGRRWMCLELPPGWPERAGERAPVEQGVLSRTLAAVAHQAMVVVAGCGAAGVLSSAIAFEWRAGRAVPLRLRAAPLVASPPRRVAEQGEYRDHATRAGAKLTLDAGPP